MSLTGQKLRAALKDNKSYKNAQPFLDEISKGNEQIVQIINPVFVDILNSDKVQLMSKLLVLRMFKDIFLLGNMNLFDSLDPQIQQVIISAAAYNPNFRSKEKNNKQTRGGMYFVDAQKRQKNTQTIQLSNSFVLLATEIIKHFALWLPENPDKTSSRFFQAYEELKNLGVIFDTSIYFQAQQQQTFHKNYKTWLEKNEATMPENQQKAINKNKSQQKIKQSGKKLQQNKQQKPGFLQQLLAPSQPENERKKQANKQSQVKSSSQQLQQKSKQIKKLIEQTKNKENQAIKLQQQISRRCQQNQELNKKVAQLQQQQTMIKKQSAQKDVKIELLQKNNKFLQNEVKRIGTIKSDAMEKIENMEKLIQQMKEEKNEIIKELQFQKQNNETKNNTQKQGSENLQKLKMELLKERNKNSKLEKLQEQLREKQQEYQRKIKDHCNVVGELKNQKSELLAQLKQLKAISTQPVIQQIEKNKKQIQEHKQQQMQQNQQKQFIPSNEYKQQFLLSQKQEKQQKCLAVNELTINHTQNQNQNTSSNPKTRQNSMSLSKFLGLKSPQQFQETFNQRTGPMNNTFHQTADNFQCKRSKNSLHKTQNVKIKSDLLQLRQNNNTYFNKTQQHFNMKKVNSRLNKNLVISVFPFIQEYFAPIKLKGSEQFRKCCFMEEARRLSFFSDQILELKLIKPKQNVKYLQISIKNKLSQSIDVNLQSHTSYIKIKQGNFYNRIHPLNQIRLSIQCNVTDLNFRVPVCCLNVFINKKQHQYNLPLPITLFSFVQLSQSPKKFENFEKYNQNNYKKHRSQRFLINKSIKSLPLAFPQLSFGSDKFGTLEAAVILTYPPIPQIKLKLDLIQSKQSCEFETQFVSQSKLSEAFSKVILQVLMFMMT